MHEHSRRAKERKKKKVDGRKEFLKKKGEGNELIFLRKI